MCIFPQACTSVLSFLISICSYVCVCFPQNCRVQTVLQTSYESWGFWLHRVGTARGKAEKNRSGGAGEHLLSSQTQQEGTEACHSGRGSCSAQSKYTECSGRPLKRRVWRLQAQHSCVQKGPLTTSDSMYERRLKSNSIIRPNLVTWLRGFHNSWVKPNWDYPRETILTF